MNEEQIKIAREELCDYLEYQCDVDEELLEDVEFLLGMKEEETEGHIFFAFKYKTSADGKELIGVAGGFEDEDDDECPIVVADNFECPDDIDDAASVALYIAIFGIQREKAKYALCGYLEDREEMDGEEPEEIKYCHVIRGERIDNRIFFVFKFKKPDDDTWYIGVGGGYKDEESTDCLAAFSGFDEYPDTEDDAVGYAFAMAEFILKHTSKNVNSIQSAIEQNMKYITNPADPEKIARQFVKTQSRTFLTVGTVDIPSGKVIVADPLSYLSGANKTAPVLEKEIPKGSYPAEIALFRGRIGIKICTARLKIKETAAVRYELARPTPETQYPLGHDLPPELEGSVTCGFPVEAGMMCFIDAEGAKDYEAYIEAFHKNNPGKNHYDDYFKVLFMASAQALPQYQSEEGDFIAWKNPLNDQSMIMAASGLGDGIYLCFWGYDEDGEICELTVPMLDPDLFEDSDDYEDDNDNNDNDLNTRWQDAYRANPRAYEMEDGGLLVNFALTEDTDSIFPLVPEEHWQIEGKTINKWMISIVSITKDSVLGDIEYHEAIKRLEKHFLVEKDGWALIKGLTLDELEELLELQAPQLTTSVDQLNNGDKIVVNIFGKVTKVEVISTGDNQFDENGQHKPDGFALSEKEIAVLNDFLENVKLADFIDQITDYCNERYEENGEEPIREYYKTPLEIRINTVAVNVCKDNGEDDPEIAFMGDCDCDEGGICIGFREGELVGIEQQDWLL